METTSGAGDASQSIESTAQEESNLENSNVNDTSHESGENSMNLEDAAPKGHQEPKKSQNKPGEAEKKTQEPAKRQPKKLGDENLDDIVTVKVNGKVEEMPLRKALELQQLERASQQKLREAAEKEKRVTAILKAVESDDDQTFKKLTGLSLDDFAESRLARKFELMQMSPEQRELHDLRQREAERAKMEVASRREVIGEIVGLHGDLSPEVVQQLEQLPREQLIQLYNQEKAKFAEAEQSLNSELAKAWLETNLPKNKIFGSWMAFEMKSHQKRTNQTLHAADAAAKVKSNFTSAVREVVAEMDAKAIEELLGGDVLKKLRDYNIQRVSGAPGSNVASANGPGNKPANQHQSKKPMNEHEWRAFIRGS